MRWGTNAVKNVSVEYPPGSGIFFFTADFSESGGTTHECQFAGGDSGGAVFSKNGDVWELAGIQVTRTLYEGQPWETALFGNENWSAQLAEYRDQILSIVAEPACDNGVDDDGDGFCDTVTGTCTDGSTPGDPGCDDWDDPFETSDALPCDDGFDNDGDELIDYPDDPGAGPPPGAPRLLGARTASTTMATG